MEGVPCRITGTFLGIFPDKYNPEFPLTDISGINVTSRRSGVP